MGVFPVWCFVCVEVLLTVGIRTMFERPISGYTGGVPGAGTGKGSTERFSCLVFLLLHRR